MSTIILTGAGASKALDYPTTTEFYDLNKFNDHEKTVYTNLLSFFKTKILDVEDVLSLLDPIVDFNQKRSGQFYKQYIANDSKITNIINFVTYTQNRCFDLYGKTRDPKEIEKLYLPLLDACNWRKQRIELFTTNYDPTTDTLLDIADTLKLNSHDGFNNRNKWDYKSYEHDINTPGINIYRLHGSMSWFKEGDTIKNTRDYNRRLNINTNEHLLIYPGYKGNPHLDNKETDAYTFPSNQFDRKILTYEKLIVIGFSFRDEYINNMISDAMKRNTKLNLTILNPEWPRGENGFLDKLKNNYTSRIHHIEEYFGNENAIKTLKEIIG